MIQRRLIAVRITCRPQQRHRARRTSSALEWALLPVRLRLGR
jgi:hypothetical protein